MYVWFIYSQTSAYEACDRTRTPLQTPTTLETSKKNRPCLIRKASRRAADRTSKITTCFIYFISSVVKIVFIYIFFTQRMADFIKLKRNMNDGKIIFLMPLLKKFCFSFLLDTSKFHVLNKEFIFFSFNFSY